MTQVCEALFRLGSIRQLLDIVPAANTNKRNQTTTIPYARRRKVINYEDEVIECAYDGTTSGDDRESPSGDESNNETPPPTTHSSVRGAYEALPKAIIHRKYRGTDDEEIDLRIGEYITNIKYTEKEYWMGLMSEATLGSSHVAMSVSSNTRTKKRQPSDSWIFLVVSIFYLHD